MKGGIEKRGSFESPLGLLGTIIISIILLLVLIGIIILSKNYIMKIINSIFP